MFSCLLLQHSAPLEASCFNNVCFQSTMDIFCRTILSESDLSRRGWKILPKVNAAEIPNWKLLCDKIKSESILEHDNIKAECKKSNN